MSLEFQSGKPVFVPEGQTIIAQRFNVGFDVREEISRGGRAEMIRPFGTLLFFVRIPAEDGFHGLDANNLFPVPQFFLLAAAVAQATRHGDPPVLSGQPRKRLAE